MLGDLESRITAVVAAAVSARAHLSVVQAPVPFPTLDAGSGAIRVALGEITAESKFERDQFTFQGSEDAPTSRRILSVGFLVLLDFRLRLPAGNGNEAVRLSSARRLLLEDMSSVSHHLGASHVHSGVEFGAAGPAPPDLGFRVRRLMFDSGAPVVEPTEEVLAGVLRYRGVVELWPVGADRSEGKIDAVDPMVVAPLRLSAARRAVPIGGGTTIRVPSLGHTRLTSVDSRERGPVELAVTVVSDLPPDARGTITSGQAGAEAGLRIIAQDANDTELVYAAPAGDPGAVRKEYVAVHLATPERRAGVLIGTLALELREAE